MKRLLLGLTSLVLAVTTASALEDGKYDCIITSMQKGVNTIKLPESKYIKVTVILKNKIATDGEEKLEFAEVYTRDDGKKFDMYQDNTFLLAVPHKDQGKKVFGFGFMGQKTNINYFGICQNAEYLEKDNN